ncbi:MAG TPA: carbamoyltransferase HypF [Candidatus Korarchaeota archaeon]|nr:carbamoyltransferase HypF [Candidatus Korarchaeota archaeon]
MKVKALNIYISGIVQGVGFRPFIHRIARKSGVSGTVRNMGGSEVEIHVEGSKEEIDRFLKLLEKEKPPPAIIEEIRIENAPVLKLSGFSILKSGKSLVRPSMIPPDIGICNYCLEEIKDPKDRRYKYAFNACAWCGPRFSLIEKIPYDRENTTMRDFPLCEECKSEYFDEDDLRRFDAQGICCPSCGPKLWLTDGAGRTIECSDPIREAVKLLSEGKILAIKGLGGFHIASLATDDAVVLELRRRKRRPQKPFALMAFDVETVKKIVYLSDQAEKALNSPQKPILLLDEREDSPVSRYVAPGLDKQGIMLPYTGLHYFILEEIEDRFLIMTSGNPPGKPMCLDKERAFRELKGIVDYYLMHNRRIINRVDDSVLRFTDGNLMFLRRSRGYAPTWIRLPFIYKRPIVAFGAELQNAGAVAFDDKVILTQYIGDTDEFEDLEELEKSLRFFLRTYGLDVREAILVVDMHPSYSSVRLARAWSEEMGVPLIKVQHHHAHAASVMADWGVKADEKVVSILMDGVGYGLDGMIWGGEVFVASYGEFERVGRLKYLPMPGGDLATRFPVRMLIGALSLFLEDEEIRSIVFGRGLLRGLKRGEIELEVAIKQARREKIIKTCSVGRFLDAISALLGICLEMTYEGEPAIKLEASARGGRIEDVGNILTMENGFFVVDTTKLLQWTLEHLDSPLNDVSASVLYALGRTLGEIAASSSSKTTMNDVFVSGGAAVNNYLYRGIKDSLEEQGMGIRLPRRIPAGDGGIALGQAAIVMAGEDLIGK